MYGRINVSLLKKKKKKSKYLGAYTYFICELIHPKNKSYAYFIKIKLLIMAIIYVLSIISES